jgi:hypothetical protein
MKVRDVYITKAQTLADSGTLTFPINMLGKIQNIRVKFGATNGATSNTVGKLCGLVSKIEVIDGSDVLCSLSMRELQASNCFSNGFMPFKDLSGGAGVVITDSAQILFGRSVEDRMYYLDASRFSNPMLRVTWAFAVSATVGIATGTGTLSLIARVIEDAAPPYMGFIMRKEVGSWTTAASGDQSFILDRAWPYKGILISALKTTIVPDTILTNLKLSVDSDRSIPFNLTGTDAFSKNVEMYGPFREKFRPLTDTAATWLSDLFYQTGAFASRPGATSKLLISSCTAESIITSMTTGGTADGNEIEVEGCAPHASVYMPFGDGFVPDDYLNPAGMGELKLILTQGVVSAAGTVVTEQLRQ